MTHPHRGTPLRWVDVENRGPGGVHPWVGHQKFISKVKLGVEFISDIRIIVFKQIISEKNIPKFLAEINTLKFRRCV